MINCGHCGQEHASVQGVRRCATGETFRCDWLVEVWHHEDPYPSTIACGAIAWEIDGGDGYECEAGHRHVGVQRRTREGWDYAEDDGEALALTMAGMEPVHMDGHIWM